MKLKAKNFNWLAGRPVVILNEETAKKLNVHVDERVSLSPLKNTKKRIYAVVDIFTKLVRKNQIGLSNEIGAILKVKNGTPLEVGASELSFAAGLIRKKLSGKRLSEKEFEVLISEVVRNNLTEAEIAYFAAAEKLKGMSIKEIIYLTEAMIKTGNSLKFNKKVIADKHSIGGVAGNRTTPIVVSICAAAGLTFPKTSSRAITSAAGTADVIETISNVEFSSKQIKNIVKKTNACIVWGGSLGLAPSDDKIIHVERILNLDVEPQLLASIISKKVSAGSKHVLIDIPYGKSAKVDNKFNAKKLGKRFKKLAEHFKIKLKAVYTDGSQPIGNGVGPVLEMLDVLLVLQNTPAAPEDLKEKSLFLSSELMALCGIKNSRKKAKEILESKKAYKKFEQIINIQNSKARNSADFSKRVEKLKPAKFKKTIYSKKSASKITFDNERVNSLCHVLGTPELKQAGVYLHKPFKKITKKQPLITLYSPSKSKLNDGLIFLRDSPVYSIK
jgi:putative thymidine phosphorylase